MEGRDVSFLYWGGGVSISMVVKHGLHYSFNRSASDSQHKSLVCVCVCACVRMCVSWPWMRVHGLTQHGALSQPTSASQNSDELWGPIGVLYKCVCVCCTCLCIYASLARQVGVNPIRLTRFKSCRPGTPKPVMWRSSCEYTTFQHSHIPPAIFPLYCRLS